MRDSHQPKDISAILVDLETANARSAIIVGGSLLESSLEATLKIAFREPASKEEQGILFSDTGILGTFWQKIWAAYFLKIIGPVARRDFDLLRLVRNEVAHNANPVTFETPEIANRCRELKMPAIWQGREPTTTRERFFAVVHMYCTLLGMRGVTLAAAQEQPDMPDDLRRAIDNLAGLEAMRWLDA
jgi:hypothetical protein